MRNEGDLYILAGKCRTMMFYFRTVFVRSDLVRGKILIPLQKSETLGETLTRFPVEVVYLEKQPKMNIFLHGQQLPGRFLPI